MCHYRPVFLLVGLSLAIVLVAACTAPAQKIAPQTAAAAPTTAPKPAAATAPPVLEPTLTPRQSGSATPAAVETAGATPIAVPVSASAKEAARAHYARGVELLYGYEDGYDETSALAEFAQASALDPDYIQAYLRQGSILTSLGDLEAAIATFDQAIARNPWAVEAYGERRATRLVLEGRQSFGDLDGAIAALDEIMATRIGDATAYAERARLHYMRALVWNRPEDLDRAIEDLDRAIELDPGMATAFHRRGLARHAQAFDISYGFQDDDEFALALLAQAIADYDMAIRLDPALADAYEDRGAAHIHIAMSSQDSDETSADAAKKEVDQAIADYSAAIRLEPGDESTLLKRAGAHFQAAQSMGATSDDAEALAARWQAMIDDATAVIQLNPDSIAAHLLRAIACSLGADAAGDPDTIDRWQELGAQDNEALEELAPALDEEGLYYWLGDPPGLSLWPVPAYDLFMMGNRSLATLGIDNPAPAGAIAHGLYTSPDGSFRIGVPEQVEPNPFIWDEIAARGDRVVAFENGATGESYVLQVHPGVLDGQSLSRWVEANVAPWFKVQQVETGDTANGPAVVLEYAEPWIQVHIASPGPAVEEEDPTMSDPCALAVLQTRQGFYSANYCSGHARGSEQPIEAAIQFLDSLELAPAKSEG